MTKQRRVRLRLETARHRIEGDVQLPDSGFRSRTTDFLNGHGRDFIALTNATLVPLDGGEPESHGFLAVSLSHVVLTVEVDRDTDDAAS